MPAHADERHRHPQSDGFHLTALIPVKSLSLGKSRLSGQYDLDHRIRLTHDSLRRAVHVLQSVSRVNEIVVISRDGRVAEWAEGWRISFIHEHQSGLNAALHEARSRYADAGAILVLPSDLVALSVTDVQAMLEAADQADEARCVVIAPDRHGHGTNALLLKPPNVIDFEFGMDSAARHAERAFSSGVQPIWFRSDSISLDLDSPDDVELYLDQW